MIPSGRRIGVVYPSLFAHFENGVRVHLRVRGHPQNGLARVLPGKRDADAGAQTLEEADHIRGEPVGPMVVELKQADDATGGLQGKERHGLVAFRVAAVACARLAVLLRGRGQQFRRAVGPETSAFREERQFGIESSADDIAAHALKHRISLCVTDDGPGLVAPAQMLFHTQELLRETVGLIVREVVSGAQADADGLDSRAFLDQQEDVVRRVLDVVDAVEPVQHVPHQQVSAFGLLAIGDVGHHHVAYGRVLGIFLRACLPRRGCDCRGVSQDGRIDPRPEVAGIGAQKSDFAGLGLAGLEQLLAALVEDVLVLLEDDPRKGPLDKCAPGHAQHGCDREVGLQDQALFADRQIARGGELVQVEIARPRGLQPRVRLAQFVVLHLELDLMHPQFMEKLPHLSRRHGFHAPRLACPGLFLRHAAKAGRSVF
jgi:hypothetical protein